jgi:formylglycine-generating enzyme required for sulfatase activity
MKKSSSLVWQFRKAILFFVTIVAFESVVSCGDDGGITKTDASVTDAKIDGSADVDVDEDGYPASEDCDDQDPDVYPGTKRDCESECDRGIEVCQDNGTWTDCTADIDCDCDEPGESRIVTCGNCGWTSQECGTDFKWELPGECLDEGECVPGKTEEEACDLCGNKSRYCDLDCTWTEWDSSECFGVCSPGDTDYATNSCAQLGEIEPLICDTDCSWKSDGPCTSDCMITPRSGNGDFKEEVCVQGGPFLMGSVDPESWEDEFPQHTVYLTPYLIDVYEVTNGRYNECINDGVCTPPPASTDYDDPEYQDHPVVLVTYHQALDFCTWDGNRTLPTEAQWEKAAKGPEPNDPDHPWGDQDPNCDLANSKNCHNGQCATVPVDTYPDGVSFYNIFGMGGNVREWCLDYYGADYYSNSPDFNPLGPSTGSRKVTRGINVCIEFVYWEASTRSRWPYDPDVLPDNVATGFRCARRGY